MTGNHTLHTGPTTSYKHAATRTVTAAGVEFAYRELGESTGTPVIFLTWRRTSTAGTHASSTASPPRTM
jgi:hypothetical protein